MPSENYTGTLDSLYLDLAGITKMRTDREIKAKDSLDKIVAQMYRDIKVQPLTQDEWNNLTNALVKVIQVLG